MEDAIKPEEVISDYVLTLFSFNDVVEHNKELYEAFLGEFITSENKSEFIRPYSDYIEWELE